MRKMSKCSKSFWVFLATKKNCAGFWMTRIVALAFGKGILQGDSLQKNKRRQPKRRLKKDNLQEDNLLEGNLLEGDLREDSKPLRIPTPAARGSGTRGPERIFSVGKSRRKIRKNPEI